MAHGTVWWSECTTGDVEAAKRHYGAVLGWTFEDVDMGGFTYVLCQAGGRPVAGIMPLAAIDGEGVPPHWMTYLAVSDMAAALAAAQESGGHVVRPPFDVPGTGTIAMVAEPGGALAGFIEPAEMGAPENG